jgi:glutathione peroxidase
MNYKTTFDLFSKVQTKGPEAAPLYKYLTGKDTNPKFAGDIEWNFTKFLVDKSGNIVARFKSNVTPDSPEFIEALEAALKG